MTKGGAEANWPVVDPASWHTVGELLRTGQYERLAKILHRAQVASEQMGDAALAHILDAARRICLACTECRAEAERHRQACEEADRREQELSHKLRAILDLASEDAPSGTPEGRERSPSAPTHEMSVGERGPPEPAERLSLRQRIQCLLWRGPGPRSPEREAATVSPAEKGKQREQAPPSLAVYGLGPFRVYHDDKLITDWPSGKGKCIFKYMIANSGRPVPKDILMDLFWRDAGPEAARNNLNVAIYGLRQAFRAIRPDFAHIVFQDSHYLLNPAMAVWVDVEEFMKRYEAGRSLEKRGKLAKAIGEYEAAESLYQGDFLKADLYQDWLMPRREGLRDIHLAILERLSRHYLETKNYAICIHLCQQLLTKDDCREDAHRRLMRCYARQGQRNLALRQYHLCVETLARVLDVSPMQETVALYNQIHRQAV
jgi:DNA-binding SARP family transcriptional activator